MQIKPSAAIRQNYNEIAKLCRETEELLAAEEERAAGNLGCTVDELDQYLEGVIKENQYA